MPFFGFDFIQESVLVLAVKKLDLINWKAVSPKHTTFLYGNYASRKECLYEHTEKKDVYKYRDD